MGIPMSLHLEEPLHLLLIFGLAKPVGWCLFDPCVCSVLAEFPVSLSQRLPALDVEGGRGTFHVLVVGSHLSLSLWIEDVVGGDIADQLAWEDVGATVGSRIGRVKTLELLEVDLEVLLPTDPVFVVLSHLKRVLDRRQRLHRQLVNEMPLLKVLPQIEAQDWRWLARVILCCVVKVCTDKVVDFGLAVKQVHALCEVKGGKVLVPPTQLLV